MLNSPQIWARIVWLFIALLWLYVFATVILAFHH